MKVKRIEDLEKHKLNCSAFSVYDYDGMSISELLCQFFTKINECIQVSNDTHDLLVWLKEIGLSAEVSKQLIFWLEDGTIKEILNEEIFNELNNKLDLNIENVDNLMRRIFVLEDETKDIYEKLEGYKSTFKTDNLGSTTNTGITLIDDINANNKNIGKQDSKIQKIFTKDIETDTAKVNGIFESDEIKTRAFRSGGEGAILLHSSIDGNNKNLGWSGSQFAQVSTKMLLANNGSVDSLAVEYLNPKSIGDNGEPILMHGILEGNGKDLGKTGSRFGTGYFNSVNSSSLIASGTVQGDAVRTRTLQSNSEGAILLHSSIDGNNKNLGWSGSKFNQVSAVAVYADTGNVSDISYKQNISYLDSKVETRQVYKHSEDYDFTKMTTKEEISDFIKNMKICQYNYNDSFYGDNEKVFRDKIGFIANEYEDQKIGQLFIEEHEDKLAYNLNNVVFMLVATIQEMDKEIQELKRGIFPNE